MNGRWASALGVLAGDQVRSAGRRTRGGHHDPGVEPLDARSEAGGGARTWRSSLIGRSTRGRPGRVTPVDSLSADLAADRGPVPAAGTGSMARPAAAFFASALTGVPSASEPL